jgi:hypothetical protein
MTAPDALLASAILCVSKAPQGASLSATSWSHGRAEDRQPSLGIRDSKTLPDAVDKRLLSEPL